MHEFSGTLIGQLSSQTGNDATAASCRLEWVTTGTDSTAGSRGFDHKDALSRLQRISDRNRRNSNTDNDDAVAWVRLRGIVPRDLSSILSHEFGYNG